MAAAPTILILTSGPLCRNPRVLKEATSLGDAGFDVTVMTVANLRRFEAYDAELLKSAKFRKVALDHVSSGGIKGARALASRLRTWLARHAARIGVQSPQALGPAAALGRMARDYSAELTIVHTEMPFCIGCGLIKRGRRVAADFEDWHSRDLLPQTRTTRPMRLIRDAERELIQRSAYTSTTSHAMAAAINAELGGAVPLVITNSFPLQAEPTGKSQVDPPSLFWFSQTIGPGRGLELFISAWRNTACASRLTLLGDVDATYKEKLINRLPAERRDHLRFLPVTPPSVLPTEIARHDVGLALELDFPTSKNCTISNKILQYLNAGVAVLASDTIGQIEVLTRAPDVGIIATLSQTTELTAKLDALLSDRQRLAAMGKAARRAAEDIYCWEREAPRLVAAAESALRRPVSKAR